MTIKEILDQYPRLPQKFLVKFALFCANDVKHLMKDKQSLSMIRAAHLWLESKISDHDMHDKVKPAYIDSAADFVACDVGYTTVDPKHAFAFVVDAVYNTIKALNTSEVRYVEKLLQMIDELTDLEKIVYRK